MSGLVQRMVSAIVECGMLVVLYRLLQAVRVELQNILFHLDDNIMFKALGHGDPFWACYVCFSTSLQHW